MHEIRTKLLFKSGIEKAFVAQVESTSGHEVLQLLMGNEWITPVCEQGKIVAFDLSEVAYMEVDIVKI